MSCAVAMYQSFHAPHTAHHYPSPTPLSGPLSAAHPTYPPQRTATVTSADVDVSSVSPHRAIDEKRQRLHEHLYRAGSSNFSLKPSPNSPSATVTPTSPAGEGDEQRDVKYINSSCMLVTYYSGDASSVVDDHFSKALSLPNSESAPLPMSQRNLPASFWNSAGYARHQLYTDPYHAASLAGLHQSPDWYYPIAANQSYPPNFSYGAAAAAGASRYNQYPSLLLQSAAAGRFGMQQGSGLDPSSYSSYMYSSGLEGSSMSEPAATKDLYWFQ